jgi:hypothetical protein
MNQPMAAAPLPTPLRSKGQKLYEMWAAASGTYTDHFPWERLSDEDQKRWTWFSRFAKVEFLHDHRETAKVPVDVQRYGTDGSKGITDYNPGFAEFDSSYDLWKQDVESTHRKHKWDYRKPPMIDTSWESYKFGTRRGRHDPAKVNETYRPVVALVHDIEVFVLRTYRRINMHFKSLDDVK